MEHRNNLLYTNNQFEVYIENKRYRFSKITNMQQEAELEEFSIGGINYGPYIARGPAKKAGCLILERGVAVGDKDVPVFVPGYYLEDPVEIVVKRSAYGEGSPRIYSIVGATVVKWELGELNASASEILIQKMEIAYEQMVLE